MDWYMIAHRLHQPLQWLQYTTTSTEFLKWRAYFDMEVNHSKVLYHYLAHILWMVNGVFGGKKTEPEQWLLKFKVADREAKPKPTPKWKRVAHTAKKGGLDFLRWFGLTPNEDGTVTWGGLRSRRRKQISHEKAAAANQEPKPDAGSITAPGDVNSKNRRRR